jgi:hypothetical protein
VASKLNHAEIVTQLLMAGATGKVRRGEKEREREREKGRERTEESCLHVLCVGPTVCTVTVVVLSW